MTMSRALPAALALAALALSPALAQDAPASLKSELLLWIGDAEDKLAQLAEATPAEKYAWRPAPGVRTTGEVFMHVAAANFGLPTFWGVAPPAGFDFMKYEKSLTAKADVQKALKDSFAHVRKALEAADEATMAKQVELFGMTSSVRGVFLLILSHGHEHLGQAIAYARSNGITPPWSAREKEAAGASHEGHTH